ncbi:MAG: thiamine protein [Gemmatimonadetes bacterium]|nr:thiamine protein [Gemmatimonadota bacterium]
MPPASPIQVRVLLFARYAELLGATALSLDLPAGSTVRDAVESLRRLPGGGALPGQLLVARNLEQVPAGTILAAGDELALLPPMSGG